MNVGNINLINFGCQTCVGVDKFITICELDQFAATIKFIRGHPLTVMFNATIREISLLFR